MSYRNVSPRFNSSLHFFSESVNVGARAKFESLAWCGLNWIKSCRDKKNQSARNNGLELRTDWKRANDAANVWAVNSRLKTHWFSS